MGIFISVQDETTKSIDETTQSSDVTTSKIDDTTTKIEETTPKIGETDESQEESLMAHSSGSIVQVDQGLFFI